MRSRLPALARSVESQPGQLKQLPDVDLQYDLCGVEAAWQPEGNTAVWQGWLPHVDTDVARAFTQRSATHDELWQQLAGAGTLTLHTSLNLRDMLRPAIQPGESIDYEFPPEEVTIVLSSNCRMEAALDGRSAKVRADQWPLRDAVYRSAFARHRATHTRAELAPRSRRSTAFAIHSLFHERGRPATRAAA